MRGAHTTGFPRGLVRSWRRFGRGTRKTGATGWLLWDNRAMETQAHKSGTVSFLITDLVGSTEQLERLGDEEAISITTMTMARLRDGATQHGGEVVKNMGDGFMVVFTSALDALACAVAMQRAVSSDEPKQDPHERLPVRIGIHAGEPIRIEGTILAWPRPWRLGCVTLPPVAKSLSPTLCMNS